MTESKISAIVSSGSNSNGEWIRFADGTQICTQHKEHNTAIQTTWGVLYESGYVDLGDYPMPFIQEPVITATVTNRAAFIEALYYSSATTWGQIVLARSQSTPSQGYFVNLIAIGRWK